MDLSEQKGLELAARTKIKRSGIAGSFPRSLGIRMQAATGHIGQPECSQFSLHLARSRPAPRRAKKRLHFEGSSL